MPTERWAACSMRNWDCRLGGEGLQLGFGESPRSHSRLSRVGAKKAHHGFVGLLVDRYSNSTLQQSSYEPELRFNGKMAAQA